MEVVEAAAAQLETLKFHGSGVGVGQGQAAQPPSPVAGPPPLLRSEEGAPDTEAPLAGEQPPELVLPSPGVGGNPAPPQLRPEPPPGGNCVTGAVALARPPDNLDTSDSDSDSDRSGACGSRSRAGDRARGAGVGRPGPGPDGMLAGAGGGGRRRSLTLAAHVLTSDSNRPFVAVHRKCGCGS